MATALALSRSERRRLSPRERIRAATNAAHDIVDAAFGALKLEEPEGYRRFLLAHQAVLPACEAALAQGGAASLLPDWEERRRAAALAADLRSLGLAIPEQGPAVPVPSPAQAWGMLYVLEGSRLGGAVLARRVADSNPDPACRNATRYLRHGEGQRFWPLFVAAFDSADLVRAEFATVTQAALRTFDLFAGAAGAAANQSFPGAVT